MLNFWLHPVENIFPGNSAITAIAFAFRIQEMDERPWRSSPHHGRFVDGFESLADVNKAVVVFGSSAYLVDHYLSKGRGW